MAETDFDGNVTVSTARQVFTGLELGRDDIIKSAIVNDGLPIREDEGFPVSDNSSILFGGFPRDAAVKGVVHDASVNLYSQETEFNTLGQEPSDTEVMEILEGSVEGRRKATSELSGRVNRLERNYGIRPDEITAYEFNSGETVQDLLRQVSRYRGEVWSDEADQFSGVEAEVPVFDSGMSGRIDLLTTRQDGTDQVRELKLGEETSRYDEFQTSAYWLMHDQEDAEAVIEYPLIDERMVFDPESDVNDFDPREYAFDVYRSRDRAKSAIENLRELQNEYFKLYDSREKATREALRDLEVR